MTRKAPGEFCRANEEKSERGEKKRSEEGGKGKGGKGRENHYPGFRTYHDWAGRTLPQMSIYLALHIFSKF